MREGGERHEDRAPRPAGHPGGRRRQDELSAAHRPVPGSGRGRRLRLRTGLEPFHADDGTLYLLEGGFRARAAVTRAPHWVAAACEALSRRALTVDALLTALDAPGRPREEALAALLDRLQEHGLLEAEHESEPEIAPGDAPERHSSQELYFRECLGGSGPARAAQAALASATVVVVGCGGLGCWALAALACAGVGRLVLVDDDRVELSNLNRQVLYRPGDVGALKVEAAARFLRDFDAGLDLVELPRRVRGTGDVRAVSAGADFVVETADWPPHHLSRWINLACAQTGVPHLSAAQRPPRVRLGPLVVPGRSPCHECLEIASRRSFPLYDQVVERQARRHHPTATLGSLSAVVGGLLAQEVLAHLTGIHPPATVGRVATLDAAGLTVAEHGLTAETTCGSCRIARGLHSANSSRPLDR